MSDAARLPRRARKFAPAVHLDDFGLHFGETLRRWRHQLSARHSEAQTLGLDEEFLRLWEFYLAYCEAGFEERQVSVVQMVLERPGRADSLRTRGTSSRDT